MQHELVAFVIYGEISVQYSKELSALFCREISVDCTKGLNDLVCREISVQCTKE